MPVDVAIHCGDLTQESTLSEFTSALALLKAIKAPLKLVIPGNHDFTLDDAVYKAKITETTTKLGVKLEEIYEVYGKVGQARQLLEETKEKDGIFLLDEGRHDFALSNGAALSVYASPYTPSSPDDDDDCFVGQQGKGKGNWGFQYTKSEGHVFDIRYTPDVVITHGPPLGVLDDVTASSSSTKTTRALGCPSLFAAVGMARPRLHCFGHVHAGWGAKFVSWRDRPAWLDMEGGQLPSHFTNIDNEESVVIETLAGFGNEESVVVETLAGFDNEESVVIKTLAGLRMGMWDSPEVLEEQRVKVATTPLPQEFKLLPTSEIVPL
ncbi:Metallo-dependent phosphatase-like protein [Neurospora tetraspora]|uniref:Metallo-dependent phosphatase-like protein n=1 Tax=Neurospora tetraspora TaxID=94610 RepID=A0AAE0MUH7_9PEZI|nr:Metallo-dependent phosphatase-like protein [Neurospora tetraspora]